MMVGVWTRGTKDTYMHAIWFVWWYGSNTIANSLFMNNVIDDSSAPNSREHREQRQKFWTKFLSNLWTRLKTLFWDEQV